MRRELAIRNGQRRWRVAVRPFRGLLERLLATELGLGEWVLGIHLVGARRMAALNWQWLRHAGSTDVITFDHRNPTADGGAGGAGDPPEPAIHGELFISVDDAAAQATSFRTTATEEVLRYAVHGVLHLLGYDDTTPVARRRMKREENRLVRRLSERASPKGWVVRRRDGSQGGRGGRGGR